MEARAVLDALRRAFASEDKHSARSELSLPDALWDSGPPLAIRGRGGAVSFANAAFTSLSEALSATHALTPVEDLAAAIQTHGRPFIEDLVVDFEGRPQAYLAWHGLVPGADPDAPYVVSCYVPADGERHRVRAGQDTDGHWRDLTPLVSDIVWECDRQTVITYISPRVSHLLGYHPQEIVGRPWSVLAGDRDELTARLRGPAGYGSFRDLEQHLVDKQGRVRRFIVQGLPVFDRETGQLTGFHGTAQQVTDDFGHEAALVQAAEAADSANRAKSEFLANMSHELRTPLNAIIGFTEIMVDEEFGPIGNDRYREYLNAVLESGRHLLNLINQVLDIAKIEAGRMQLIEDSADPTDLVRATVRVVSANARRRNIELRTSIADDSLHLWVDEVKLRQILLNLLSNSLKFTLDGGQVEISAGLDRDGTFLFRVRDSGIGIDPASFDTVLTPFEQIDSVLTRRFEGTGLGLPLSKALAEAHGGSLALDSAVGKGTTVTVRLPASRVRRR